MGTETQLPPGSARRQSNEQSGEPPDLHNDSCTDNSPVEPVFETERQSAPVVFQVTNQPAESNPLTSGQCSETMTTKDKSPGRYAGIPVSQLCCVELCAGVGRLSAHLKRSGFDTFSIDHAVHRSSALHASIRVDLAKKSSLLLLKTILATRTVCYVHAALPFGTCRDSRSLKRLCSSLRFKSTKRRALRSVAKPEGIEGLSETELSRLNTANNVFQHACALLSLCCASGIAISIENPSNSLLWQVPCIQRLARQFSLVPVKFQQCAWGSKSKRWTTFLTNCVQFASLEKGCECRRVLMNGASRFTPIGSKDAAAYPPALCEAVAALVLRSVLMQGACKSVQHAAPCNDGPPESRHKVEAGKQPRGSRHPPIISELIGCRWLPWGSQEPPKGTFKLDEATCARLAVPFPSKVLQWRLCEGRAEATADGVDVEMPADARYEVYVGTYRSCEQFVQEALQLEHPFDTDSSICDDLKIAVFELMTLGPSLLKLRREEVLRHYTERRTALQEQEQHLHSMLDEPRQRVIQDKQILLFNEMARDAGIQDPELFHAQVVGASLVGEQPHCPLFREVRRDAALSVEQLMLSAKWSREACHEKASDAATDAVLWEEAMQEVEAGWLQGPLSEQQVAEIVGPLFVVSPRFGLKQPDKVRAIDDLTSSLVNLAFASTSKLDLGGVDEIAVLARTMLECVQDDRTVILRLSDGTELRGELSLELDVAEARLIVGRTLDLESAYKQCLVAKTSLWASVLAIANPSGVRELFLSHALPFGACSSVYAFNRIARSLHVIGIRLFGLIWCNFYDDFPQLSLARSGNADVEVAEAFLGLIGWRFSRKERKRQPFRTSFDGLGVTFNFARSAEGFFEVSNKSGRVQQIHAEIEQILSVGSLPQPQAASLMGRLHFAESQLFGRAAVNRMRLCHARASGRDPGSHISAYMADELRWVTAFLSTCAPRQLRVRANLCPVAVFTDASLDVHESVGRVGGVVFVSRQTGQTPPTPMFFASDVPSKVLSRLQKDTKHVIAALEMMAVLIAVDLWGAFMSSKRCFFFVDNDSARGALIAAYSPSIQLNELVSVWNRLVIDRSIFQWVCRVPSPSNIADAPSRNDTDKLIQAGSAQHQIRWDVVLGWLREM